MTVIHFVPRVRPEALDRVIAAERAAGKIPVQIVTTSVQPSKPATLNQRSCS